MTLTSKLSCIARLYLRGAFIALAIFGAVGARAASPIGQSFTVSGTGSFTLNSVTFQNVSFPYAQPGVENVINIFAYDPAGLNAGNAGYDTATPILFTSTSFSTSGLLSTYNFTGATLTGGVSYYAVFDKGGLFDIGGDTFSGGVLLYGNNAASGPDGSADATNFAVSVSAVPEPSTYAAIFGALALGAVGVVRQRRRAAAVQN